MTNTNLAHAGVIARAWDWLERRFDQKDEFANLSQHDLREMAEDLGLSEQDLYAAAAPGVDCTPELHGMMRATGLDPQDVQHRYQTIMRDIQITCIRCTSRAHCARELAAGRAGESYHAYCANAATFDELAKASGSPA